MSNRTVSLWRRGALLKWAVGHHSNPKAIAGIRIVKGVVRLMVAYSPCIRRDQHGIELSSPIVCYQCSRRDVFSNSHGWILQRSVN